MYQRVALFTESFQTLRRQYPVHSTSANHFFTSYSCTGAIPFGASFSMAFTFKPYTPAAKYKTAAAYFSMEFAVDQALKTYSGGLGFLAGSHMRSGFELKQNLVGISILWSFGYYDQDRNADQSMKPEFRQKHYSFLEDTGIIFPITIHGADVQVKAL